MPVKNPDLIKKAKIIGVNCSLNKKIHSLKFVSYVLFGDLTEDDSLSCCCPSVVSDSSCLMLCSTSGFPVLYHLPELAQTHVHSVSDVIHHIDLCHPLLLLSLIFPSIRVFSNESGLRIRWLKYWSFRIIPFSDIHD